MKLRQLMTIPALLAASLLFISLDATAETKQLSPAEVKQLKLQRIYNLRMQIEQERARNENEARNNVRLVTQQNPRSIDSPSVSAYRQDTRQQLTRFEQQFRCLDVDVDSNGGNTVVICGDNSGDISGSNTSAGRDLVTIPGGRR
ncbi:MAG: hypothetical protein GKR90_10935 [Pseudomonadales bacterium]|nr:hypothetical protein [Pseudomonadales bacterium]